MTYVTEKLSGREREKDINTKMRVKLEAKLLIIAWTLMKILIINNSYPDALETDS